jgi:arylsulfatase A-like enzyme
MKRITPLIGDGLRRAVALQAVATILTAVQTTPAAESVRRPPNILFILADDLGYGDLGCYGQEKIKTPNLDRLAAAGMRFTDCYAGSTVCAPSRCALMTGLHTGHCRVRGNGGGGGPRSNVALRPEDRTVAEVLKSAGYATGLVGKWGLGEEGSTGVPTKKGFDSFYGYLNQHHAHNYYPPFLLRGEARVSIPENVQRADVENVAKKSVVYSPDLLLAEALAFLEQNKAKPFFLEFATIVPHANNEKTRYDNNGNEVPSDAPYTSEPWPQQEKNKAAMITRLDRDIGTVLDKLRSLGLENETIVFFTSDNGPHREGGNDPDFFRSSGPLRGIKRAMYDGGIRVPMIVRWPGRVKAGAVSDVPWAFWDVLPTLAQLAGAKAPDGLDGISMVPTLLGRGAQPPRPYFYWEFHEGGSKQAVRFGDWKAVRLKLGGPVELYDLKTDVGERNNLAVTHRDLVAKAEELFTQARTEHPVWPLRDGPSRPNAKQ